jgi:hypothetical protein
LDLSSHHLGGGGGVSLGVAGEEMAGLSSVHDDGSGHLTDHIVTVKVRYVRDAIMGGRSGLDLAAQRLAVDAAANCCRGGYNAINVGDNAVLWVKISHERVGGLSDHGYCEYSCTISNVGACDEVPVVVGVDLVPGGHQYAVTHCACHRRKSGYRHVTAIVVLLDDGVLVTRSIVEPSANEVGPFDTEVDEFLI